MLLGNNLLAREIQQLLFSMLKDKQMKERKYLKISTLTYQVQ